VGDGLPAPRHFGRDGREEAEELLARRSGSPDKPRILNAFNEPIDDWASASSCSRCSPTATASTSSPPWPRAGSTRLARTTRFMLTEEAHHLFVGEMGVDRVVQRTAELMAQGKTAQAGRRPAGHDQRY